MAQSYNQKLFVGKVVEWEAGVEYAYCRQAVNVAKSQTIIPGQVLMNATTYAEAYVDGTGISADAVALDYVTTTSAYGTVLALVRGPAILHSAGLTGSDANGVADLLALGIIVRTDSTSFDQE